MPVVFCRKDKHYWGGVGNSPSFLEFLLADLPKWRLSEERYAHGDTRDDPCSHRPLLDRLMERGRTCPEFGRVHNTWDPNGIIKKVEGKTKSM